jgi:hypothetical protein
MSITGGHSLVDIMLSYIQNLKALGFGGLISSAAEISYPLRRKSRGHARALVVAVHIAAIVAIRIEVHPECLVC